MNQKEFIQFIKDFYKKNLEIVEKKNQDYSGEDTFKAFKLTEVLGNTTVEQGLIVRIGDKLSRISTLLKQKRQVDDETIADTLSDLSNYAAILAAYMSQKPCKDGDDGDNISDVLVYDTENFKVQKQIFKYESPRLYGKSQVEMDEPQQKIDNAIANKQVDMLTREDFDVKGALDKTLKVINNAPQYLQFNNSKEDLDLFGDFLKGEYGYGIINNCMSITSGGISIFLIHEHDYLRFDPVNKSLSVLTEKNFNKLMDNNG